MFQRVVGLYGFQVQVDPPRPELSRRLAEAPWSWPSLLISLDGEPPPTDLDLNLPVSDQVQMSDRFARVAVPEGTATMDRHAGRAWFSTSTELSVDQLVHPLLGHVALAFGYWLGREAFHAGVFEDGDGVWALLGDRHSGKSTTLAWLANHGRSVVADDILMLDGLTAFAGPRTVDLVSASALHLGMGGALERVRGGERHRLGLEPVAAEHRLLGWIALEWADEVSISPLPPAQRLPLLVNHGHQPRGEARWADLLGLAALPAYVLRRPPRLTSLSEAGGQLLAALAARTS
jgi:hypothetical protein